MSYKIEGEQLPNGLNVFYCRTQSQDISITATVQAGSLYETESTRGISHFIEHLTGKGTRKRASRHSIHKTLYKLGISFQYHTMKDKIELDLTTLPDDFDIGLDFIADLLFQARISPRDVESERLVVLREIKESEDNYPIMASTLFEETLFSGSKLAWHPLGLEERIMAISYQDIYRYYKKAFNPSNTTLFIAGPKSFQRIRQSIYHHFSKFKKGEDHTLHSIEPPENKPSVRTIEKDLENVYMILGKIVKPVSTEDAYALTPAAALVNQSINRWLLDHQPLSYTRGFSLYPERFANTLRGFATCDPKKYEEISNKIRIIMQNKRLVDYYFEADIKDSITNLEKRFKLSNTTTSGLTKNLMSFWFGGDIYSINRYTDQLRKITLQQVKDTAKRHFQTNDLTEVAIGRI